MSEKPIIACKRCRVKKLKCDDEPKTCKNCLKGGVPCVHVDSRSRREYARGYVEELLDRIRHLNGKLNNSEAQAVEMGDPSPASLSSPGQTTYRGDGSVASMARLVEAAVATPAASISLYSIGLDTTAGREAAGTRVSLAMLPPLEAGQQLFASYLNGLHLLHPFLHRSTVLQELNEAYTQRGSMSPSAMFRIYMIFAIGAVSLVRAGLHDVSPVDYYAAAMHHAEKTLGLSSLEHIQALLLVLIFSLQHDVGVGSKWDLARVAMRVCVENNFHKKTVNSCDLMVDQMQRRAFWACYISDRHSSSVLGVPMALQEEDIDAELPIDADDDLIENGNIEGQIFRGMSEVSAQLRQIRLRQITSKIGTRLYRTASHRHMDLQTAVDEILGELDEWRDDFPIIVEPRNIYESAQWRDLNYFRERLKCFRLLMLAKKDHGNDEVTLSLDRCCEATAQIASLYRSMRTSDKLIMNWTCVHDMMSAGFTNLYCAIAQRDIAREDSLTGLLVDRSSSIQETTSAIIDTLTYIAEKWPSVQKHVHVFKALASRVDDSMRTDTSTQAVGVGERTPSIGTIPDISALEGSHWDANMDHHADTWDAAMAAFLDEPLDLGNIDWGAVDWDAMQLLNDE